jgi:hypothetical protein
MFLPVAWIPRTNFIPAWDAEEPGVGRVERNTVRPILTRQRGSVFLRRRINTIRFVAKRRMDSRRRIIAQVAILDTAAGGGNTQPLAGGGNTQPLAGGGNTQPLAEGGMRKLKCFL